MMIGVTVWIGLGALAALAIGRASAIGTDAAPGRPREIDGPPRA